MLHFISLHVKHHHLPIALFQSCLNRGTKTLHIILVRPHTVDHELYTMILISIELHARSHLLKLSINSDIYETFLS